MFYGPNDVLCSERRHVAEARKAKPDKYNIYNIVINSIFLMFLLHQEEHDKLIYFKFFLVCCVCLFIFLILGVMQSCTELEQIRNNVCS